MKEIRLVGILIMCFVLFGFALGGVSAQEPLFEWDLDGWVYYMISPPYMPEDRDPQVNLTDNLGPYDETQWRFFRYDPALGRYAELKSSDWNSVRHDLDFGRGYWIISRNPAKIDIGGEPVAKNWIILQHEGNGWNQIGNIYDYDFPVVNLFVARIDDPDPWNNKVQLIDDDPITGNNLTYVTLQEYENGAYFDIPGNGKNSLEGGKAYWLRVLYEKYVILFFVPSESSALGSQIYLSEEFYERIAQQDDPPDPPPGIESSSSVSGSGSGGCFIATAAYGDYDHPMVQLMREFRDRYLLANSLGRAFVDLYYRYSPTLARFVAKRESIKAVIRLNLTPLVATSAIVSKMNICGLLIVLTSLFLSCFVSLRRRRGSWGECKLKFWGKMREKRRE